MPAAPSTEGGNCARKSAVAVVHPQVRLAGTEIGRGAAAVVHDNASHAIRILVEREPDPPQLLEQGALTRAAITRDRANDGPAALESICGRNRAIQQRERRRPRACAAGRSACPGHSLPGASPRSGRGRWPSPPGRRRAKRPSGTGGGRAASRRRVGSMRLSGLAQAEDEPDRRRERREGKPLHGVAQVAVGRRAGHDPVADVAVRHARIEQHLARREFAT